MSSWRMALRSRYSWELMEHGCPDHRVLPSGPHLIRELPQNFRVMYLKHLTCPILIAHFYYTVHSLSRYASYCELQLATVMPNPTVHNWIGDVSIASP